VIRLLRFSAFLIVAGSVVVAQTPASKGKTKVALYAGVGHELTTYSVDLETASLVKQSSVTLPENVQEAWPHPSKRYLYVCWSSSVGGPGHHGVTAFRIDPNTGALQQHGEPISLAARAVFMNVDMAGHNLVIAHNLPSGMTVHRIAADGTLGAAVPQAANLDFGIFGHNVRVDPSDQMVILVTRGNAPTATTPENPGAVKVFGYKDGVLTNRASIAPPGGLNFQSRHLDFHPTRPFVFLTLEKQNKLQVYRKLDGPTLSAKPLFTKETLADPSQVKGQNPSTVHVHPNGRFVYVANRGTATTQFEGKTVFAGGENSIAVYSVNLETGEPTLIQSIDTRGVHPRTFSLDPSGRILVAANQQEILVRDKEGVRTLPASLSVFRIGGDGKLEFVRKYDQDSRGGSLFWAGMVGLP